MIYLHLSCLEVYTTNKAMFTMYEQTDTLICHPSVLMSGLYMSRIAVYMLLLLPWFAMILGYKTFSDPPLNYFFLILTLLDFIFQRMW